MLHHSRLPQRFLRHPHFRCLISTRIRGFVHIRRSHGQQGLDPIHRRFTRATHAASIVVI
jgi:hypothetical protein